MASNLPRDHSADEHDLLIEAVSLLVEHQRAAETWVAEQLVLADERAASRERESSEIHSRLDAIEQQLAKLARKVDLSRPDSSPDERLLRLREQVEQLKSDTSGRGPLSVENGAGSNSVSDVPPSVGSLEYSHRQSANGSALAASRPPRSMPPGTNSVASATPDRSPAPAAEREFRQAATSSEPVRSTEAERGPSPVAQSQTGSGPRQYISAMIGASPDHRFGFVLIAAGLGAVCYAAFMLLRFG